MLASLCKGLLTEGGGREARDLQPREQLSLPNDFDSALPAGEWDEAAVEAGVGEGFMETLGQASKPLQRDLAEFETWTEGNQSSRRIRI